MTKGRVLRIRYESQVIGFRSAHIEEDSSAGGSWRLRVESPENLDEFRDSLAHGRCIALSLFAADGVWYAGEACVAFVSDGETFSVVTLAGEGPLRRS